jgi:DNA-binding NarL/FixJ family response regulator
MIRLFLVDDHAVLREGLRMLLEQEPDLAIMGEAANGQLLLDQLPTTPVDIVLLDLNMPVMGGVATAERLRTDYPDLRILMLSMVEDPLSIQQTLAAGAHGYLLKNTSKEELLAGLRTVQAGRRFLGSEIGLTLLEEAAGRVPAALPARSVQALLSRREHEILQLVAKGLTNQQIADQLFTSKRTVETHRQHTLEKTGCKNTAVLISYASTHGLLTASAPHQGAGLPTVDRRAASA